MENVRSWLKKNDMCESYQNGNVNRGSKCESSVMAKGSQTEQRTPTIEEKVELHRLEKP